LVLLLTDFSAAASQFNFEMADYFISVILIVLLPIVTFYKLKHKKLFRVKLDFSSFIITILLLVFIFSPLISYTHPDFQKNIGLTKLLPPLSKAIFMKFEKQQTNQLSRIDKFTDARRSVIKYSFDSDLIFIDSLKAGEKIFYYQKEQIFELSSDSLKSNKLTPKLDTKIFLLGTDEFGRDIFARLLFGARISIFVGICSVLLSFLIGFVMGSFSGYSGGKVDIVLNRLSDTFLSFPSIFLIIIILALFGNSLLAVIIVLGFSGWMSLFKIVRGEVISLKQKDFFISARMIGLSPKQLLVKEILPVVITPIVVNLVYLFGGVILAEAALSYLGLGTGTNYPSWGGMIDAGQNYLRNAWWMIFFPGIALILTLYAANDLGQKIKIYFNPQLRK
jgi:peptide/nickel transport system permease protein